MIIFQKFIFRSDLQENPDVLYLFGDNLQRKGYGGQAKEMRGEDNAVGIATKRNPGMEEEDFFTDEDYDEFVDEYWKDIQPVVDHLEAGGSVIIPFDGLGTGLAQLPDRAPRIHEYIEEHLTELQGY